MAQVAQLAQVENEGGNTITPSSIKGKSRGWCFTINNWTEEILAQTHSVCDSQCYIIGKEKGKKGTPHLQGYIYFKNARSFKSVKKMLPTAHLEKSKGSKKDNYNYCSKEGDFETNMDFRTPQEKLIELCLEEYKDVKWKPWQQNILDILNTKPDRRTIHWFWEPTGNVGKSYLCKYLALTKDVIICEGKKNDVFNQIRDLIEKGKIPNIILCDIPRSSMDYINYGALEEIKNGCLYSGKYEGGQCIFPCPHVIILANTAPPLDEMSKDRWNVVKI